MRLILSFRSRGIKTKLFLVQLNARHPFHTDSDCCMMDLCSESHHRPKKKLSTMNILIFLLIPKSSDHCRSINFESTILITISECTSKVLCLLSKSTRISCKLCLLHVRNVVCMTCKVYVYAEHSKSFLTLKGNNAVTKQQDSLLGLLKNPKPRISKVVRGYCKNQKSGLQV